MVPLLRDDEAVRLLAEKGTSRYAVYTWCVDHWIGDDPAREKRVRRAQEPIGEALGATLADPGNRADAGPLDALLAAPDGRPFAPRFGAWMGASAWLRSIGSRENPWAELCEAHGDRWDPSLPKIEAWLRGRRATRSGKPADAKLVAAVAVAFAAIDPALASRVAAATRAAVPATARWLGPPPPAAAPPAAAPPAPPAPPARVAEEPEAVAPVSERVRGWWAAPDAAGVPPPPAWLEEGLALRKEFEAWFNGLDADLRAAAGGPDGFNRGSSIDPAAWEERAAEASRRREEEARARRRRAAGRRSPLEAGPRLRAAGGAGPTVGRGAPSGSRGGAPSSGVAR